MRTIVRFFEWRQKAVPFDQKGQDEAQRGNEGSEIHGPKDTAQFEWVHRR